MSETVEAFKALRAPFREEEIGKLPKGINKGQDKAECRICGGWHEPAKVHLDYIGHAAVTDRLLEVDPAWNWEPVAWDPERPGQPAFVRDAKTAQPVRLWIRLTICGVTRLGVGSVEAGAVDAEKQLIGDALRNAAMRFGVGLDLWKKEDRGHAASHPPADASSAKATSATPQVTPAPEANGADKHSSPAQQETIRKLAAKVGVDPASLLQSGEWIESLTWARAGEVIEALDQLRTDNKAKA